ncbi:NAD(P)-dependent oxidoreductase [Halobacteria archaeon AArc-dxtr1]|nr:NAD(P)-dependent oxidoreductase [Halobacteria archaeon AArc-dxtr1]
METVITGPYGRCGTALIDHLRDDHAFTYVDRIDPDDDHPYGGYDTVVADVADDVEALEAAFEGADAVVHLAGYPHVDSTLSDVLEPNIVGTANVLEAARDTEIETVVFASSNHVVGGYERDHAPALYRPEYGLVLDRTAPVRPDSYYGVSKCFGEALGRYAVETDDYPRRFYALRIGSVRDPAFDHPYGDAERGVDDGDWSRGSDAYDRQVARMKATWHSRRDFAQLVDRCLRDDTVEFDVFYGVSGNQRRWFDLEHARATLGYVPEDDGETWDAPPKRD